jgi:hypothetical protein
MLSPLTVSKREVEDKIGIEGVGDAAERRQPWLMLAPLETGNRRLRDAATPRELDLREAVLDSEGDELPGDLLVGRELMQRRFVLRILQELSV